MNLTIGNPVSSVTRHARLRHLSLAAGLAVALGVAIGLGALGGGGDSAASLPSSALISEPIEREPYTLGAAWEDSISGGPSESAVAAATQRERKIVAVVGSEADAERLEAAISQAKAFAGSDSTSFEFEGLLLPLYRTVVLVIEPGEEGLYNTIVGEQMATGAFSVIDMRDQHSSLPNRPSSRR